MPAETGRWLCVKLQPWGFSSHCVSGRPLERGQGAPEAPSKARLRFSDEQPPRAERTRRVLRRRALVTERHQPLFSCATGWADRERGEVNHLDTRFNVGSIGKSFTAAAIMQLAEEGKLLVTDTIGQHLPNYPRPAADMITIHHLLTHRSGLPPSFLNDRFWALKDSLHLNRDYLQLFIDQPLAFEPGTRTLYSNPGYVVLGAIIESVSGEEYSAYIRRHIFEPAGMNQTDWPTGHPRKIAVGYTFFNAPPTGERQRTEPLPGPQASGGQQSTVRDLIQFALALQAGRLMSPASLELMTTGKESMEPSGRRSSPMDSWTVG